MSETDCACCGEPRPERDLARMACRPEIAVCGGCVDRMAGRLHARPSVTPIFPVRDMAEARQFWTAAGLDVDGYDEGYAFVLAGGAEVAHLALQPDLLVERNSAACYVHVGDPEGWHQRWTAAGLPVSALQVQPWGMREFSLRDPSGNLIRVGAAA